MSTTKTPTKDNGYRVLGPTRLRKLEDAWLRLFHSGGKLDRPNAEVWFNVVMDNIIAQGDEVIPSAIIDEEHKIMERGLSQEYMAALADVVDASDARSEYDKAVLILTATPEARLAAIQKVKT